MQILLALLSPVSVAAAAAVAQTQPTAVFTKDYTHIRTHTPTEQIHTQRVHTYCIHLVSDLSAPEHSTHAPVFGRDVVEGGGICAADMGEAPDDDEAKLRAHAHIR